MNFVAGIHLSNCFTIDISGETYIKPGVPYKVTCTVSDFLENRRTFYSAIIFDQDATDVSITDRTTGGCVYKTTITVFSPCQSSICSCDIDGLATQWTYSPPTDLSSSVAFVCSSKNNEGYLFGSEKWIPTIPSKCFVLKLIKFCVSEGRQIFLRNYVYLSLTYMQFVTVESLVIYVSISNMYIYQAYITI